MSRQTAVSTIGPLNIDLLMTGQGPQSWDEVPAWDGPAQMEMTAAGSVGYTVRDLARLGLGVAVASCVSDDALGTFIVETLQREGVDTGLVRRVPGTLAGIGVYMLLFGSRKRPLAYRLPTHDPWPARFSAGEVERLLQAGALLCGGYLHFSQMWHGQTVEVFQEARRRGVRTVLDPQFPLAPMDAPWLEAMADILPVVDLLLLDEHEALASTAAADLEEAAQRLLESGPQIVIVKQGAEGSTVHSAGHRHPQPAIHLGEVVDSIGAGDAFDASFVFGWLQGWSLERCALFASVAAGMTVTGTGGSQTMPTAAEVEAIIQARRLE